MKHSISMMRENAAIHIRIEMTILTESLPSLQNLSASWLDLIHQNQADITAQFIGPEETKLNPYVALRVRISILLRTYNNEYHTDAYDIFRLAKNIVEGQEQISFWGDSSSISILRQWLSSPYEPTEEEIAALKLGTATKIVEEQFGTGLVEMCRTGTVSDVSAVVPILYDLYRTFHDTEDSIFSACNTFFSVPRNRKSLGQIRGGAAIHRMHVRHIQSSFWGIAPWYVMQGGFLEVLDYREVYRNPLEVAERIENIPRIYCTNARDRDFITVLLELNLGRSIKLPIIEQSRVAPSEMCFHIFGMVRDQNLKAYNPVFIRPSPTGEYRNLQSALQDIEIQNYAAIVVILPLVVESMSYYQWLLNTSGYQLSIVSPSNFSIENTFPEYFWGMWSKPNPALSLALPYYFDVNTCTSMEKTVIEFLSNMCTSWENLERS